MTTQVNIQAVEDDGEDVEGLGNVLEETWGDYPIDEMLIRNETRTVNEVLRRIHQDRFIMDPDFQRDFIWEEDKQSKLIESVLMRIPLPVFYLGEDDIGRMVVVDGLQRISTFNRFVCDELKLQLPDRPELHGKRFTNLSAKLQNRVEDCNLILYVIDSKAPEQARLDIFERVNGGVPLTRQQMRNCLYMGEATRFLREESKAELFLRATGRSLKTSAMRDREFVNRFCAFQTLPVDEYRNMDDFLARSLKKMNAKPESLPMLSEQFKTTLSNNLTLFGKHAFRKQVPGQDYRSVLNASLWDVMSTGLSRYPDQLIIDRSAALRSGFYRLMDDDEFIKAITYSTNSMKQVRDRFAISKAMLDEVLGAYQN